jgi:cytochrome bd ubiquinol oxidase subunit II
MHLYDIPMVFVLAGLALYTVLGGADFGAGIWQLLAGRGEAADRIRDHAHDSMAPVWEANHVWLVFVLTVFWTAYPTAFGSIASTLSIPLFLAGLGIVLRGAAYAARSGTRSRAESRRADLVFAGASLLTPFALGTVVGAIAAGTVPVGNAAGAAVSSWTGSLSILIGLLAVATSAYLGAVFLAADAVRLNDRDLAERFRARALATGAVAGALAIGGLVVLHSDAPRVYHRLTDGPGLPALIVSVAAGLLALGLIHRRRYEPARYAAAAAVAAIIAGWGLAQRPVLLPGETIAQAAAPHDTLVLLIVAVLAGGAILFPSLALLFRLVLSGRLDHSAVGGEQPDGRALLHALAPGLATRAAGACLLAGFAGLTIANAAWAHAIGVVCLLAFVPVGFVALAPTELTD